MAGEIYDYDALVSGLKTIKQNIVELEAALASERAKELEYGKHIMDAERLLRMHKREDLIADGGKE